MSAPLQLSVASVDGHSLTVTFQFVNGRFRQLISLSDAHGVVHDQWEDAIESADSDWPSSPPIQQLSLESINDRPTLLGVGQAGKSHWSISVEQDDTSEKKALRFDLACRTRSLPLWLGSTYERLAMPPSAKQSLVMRSENGTQSDANALAIRCDLTHAGEARYPATFRWSYWIAMQTPLTHPSRLP